MTNDEYWMRQALKLASLGRHASPNPMVGCVIIGLDGARLGRGFHPEPGSPHAEIYALAEAGERAKGATAYVTLEPCSHFGRTPPCADALIKAGVSRVVASMLDPDTRVSGQGARRLIDAGIRVDTGVLEREAHRLNEAYIKHRLTGLPFVTVKVASTLDGKIASATGDSKWITSQVTRNWVHRRLRDRVDAIIVGIGTVLADNPALTTRLTSRVSRHPLRVVVDSHLRIRLNSQLVTPGALPGKTVVACLSSAPEEKKSALESQGTRLIVCGDDGDGHVNLRELMKRLGAMNITHALIEGGGLLIGGALRAGLVDRYISTIAPKIIGGSNAPSPVMGAPLSEEMKNALSPKSWILRRCGPDIVVDSRFE
jgi:diaminohydroxyphosphoribosylaminopyrimidine deaminase/5-amino-6-(5-phosphoribosylamino)uracil reductase